MNGSLAWKFRCQAKTSATATALNPSREAIRRSTNPNLSTYFRLAFSRLSCFGQLLLELGVISLRRAEHARSLLFRKSEEPAKVSTAARESSRSKAHRRTSAHGPKVER